MPGFIKTADDEKKWALANYIFHKMKKESKMTLCEAIGSSNLSRNPTIVKNPNGPGNIIRREVAGKVTYHPHDTHAGADYSKHLTQNDFEKGKAAMHRSANPTFAPLYKPGSDTITDRPSALSQVDKGAKPAPAPAPRQAPKTNTSVDPGKMYGKKPQAWGGGTFADVKRESMCNILESLTYEDSNNPYRAGHMHQYPTFIDTKGQTRNSVSRETAQREHEKAMNHHEDEYLKLTQHHDFNSPTKRGKALRQEADSHLERHYTHADAHKSLATEIDTHPHLEVPSVFRPSSTYFGMNPEHVKTAIDFSKGKESEIEGDTKFKQKYPEYHATKLAKQKQYTKFAQSVLNINSR